MLSWRRRVLVTFEQLVHHHFVAVEIFRGKFHTINVGPSCRRDRTVPVVENRQFEQGFPDWGIA